MVTAAAQVTTAAQVQSLAWQFPHAMGMAKKRKVFRNILFLKVQADLKDNAGLELPSWHSRNESDWLPCGFRFDPWPLTVG